MIHVPASQACSNAKAFNHILSSFINDLRSDFSPRYEQTLGLPTAKVPEGTLQLPSWVDPMEQSSHTKVIQAVTFLGMVNFFVTSN